MSGHIFNNLIHLDLKRLEREMEKDFLSYEFKKLIQSAAMISSVKSKSIISYNELDKELQKAISKTFAKITDENQKEVRENYCDRVIYPIVEKHFYGANLTFIEIF